MLNIFGSILSILLIILILINVPSNTGLESIATKVDFLGSPNSVKKFINLIILILISLYLILAINFNLSI